MNDITPRTAGGNASTMAWIGYGLYAAGFLVGITSIAAIIFNYVKRSDVAGTLAESHFTWQIRTFWFGLLWGFVGIVLMIVLIGWLVLIANLVWVVYRLVAGALALNDGQAIVPGKFGLSAAHASAVFGKSQ